MENTKRRRYIGIIIILSIIILGVVGFKLFRDNISLETRALITKDITYNISDEISFKKLVNICGTNIVIYIDDDTTIINEYGEEVNFRGLMDRVEYINFLKGLSPNTKTEEIIYKGKHISREEINEMLFKNYSYCIEFGDKISNANSNEFNRTDGLELTKKSRIFKVKTLKLNCTDVVFVCEKPVIYLYPDRKMEVDVNISIPSDEGRLTCTYPKYKNTGDWKVTASPDGTITDKNGLEYNYLYWEAESYIDWDFSEGFCIAGEDTADFLEVALERLGLNRREANEFIVYWLPIMESNKYNIISFQTDIYKNYANLDINPAPDTLIRVFMAFKPSNKYVSIDEQDLITPIRVGFVVVEWGGTQVVN